MTASDWLGLLQWPAMVVTLAASWLVASTQRGRRNTGFWLFLLSNVLWVAWGLHASAFALIALQLGLAALNVRGASKSDDEPGDKPSDKPGDKSDHKQADQPA